jgi:hypothetical protein
VSDLVIQRGVHNAKKSHRPGFQSVIRIGSVYVGLDSPVVQTLGFEYASPPIEMASPEKRVSSDCSINNSARVF